MQSSTKNRVPVVGSAGEAAVVYPVQALLEPNELGPPYFPDILL